MAAGRVRQMTPDGFLIGCSVHGVDEGDIAYDKFTTSVSA